MTTAVAEDELVSLADRLAEIGDVPTHRILLLNRTPTVDDVQRLAERDPKRLCELVDGFLVEKAIGINESFVSSRLIIILGAFLNVSRLGRISGEQGAVRLFPQHVRMPDVSFFSWKTLPVERSAKATIPFVAPDLVAEVLSDSNTAGEMERKRRDYFAAGVKLIWEVDPQIRLVQVYEPGAAVVELRGQDELTGGDVLPGFSVKVAELFVDLGPAAG